MRKKQPEYGLMPLTGVYPSIKIDFFWARASEYQDFGYSELNACLLSSLEIEHRKELAREIGPHRAYLARLIRTREKHGYSLSLEYDEPFADIADLPFKGFREVK